MRCSGQKQVVIRVLTKKLTQFVPLRLVDLRAVAIGRHLVGFIHDAQVKVYVTQQLQDIVLTGDEINRGNALWCVFPDVSAIGRIDGGSVDNAKRLAELIVQFPPPLVGQVGRGNDKGPLDQATKLQFLEHQSRHDRFACTGVVSNQKSDTGLREQVCVDRIHLVRERVDLGH
ncbi:hypothetical protein NKDENANG_03685 [Candidatus Entotheonellaceae bacterium PAL068K]